MDLRRKFGRPVLFHWVGWHGKDGPSLTGYDSRDPHVIGNQLDWMRAVGGDGYGVIALTFGPTVSAFIHAAVMEMSRQCSDRSVPFALCFDPWTVKDTHGNLLPSPTRENAMITALKDSDTQTMLNSRSYLPGHPVLDFSTGVDPKAILAAVPGIEYWTKNVDYSWIETTNTLTTLAHVNALPTMKLPGVCLQFDDGTGPDRNKSAQDQTKPARVVPSRAGGLFRDMAGLAPISLGFLQVITWNDVKEGTDCEKFSAMVAL